MDGDEVRICLGERAQASGKCLLTGRSATLRPKTHSLLLLRSAGGPDRAPTGASRWWHMPTAAALA